MKEFSAQTGGRYTYADDLENLQELALALSLIHISEPTRQEAISYAVVGV